MSDIREALIKYTQEHLIDLVLCLMDTLNEKERIEFISRHISAEIALEAAGYDDSGSYLRKVSAFCKDCLNGDYYVEPEYDDYYDEEAYDKMGESGWADNFTEYLKLAVMYSRNKNYDVSCKAFDELLDCLHEAEFDEELLGTGDPIAYIDVDWDEVFSEYYASMKEQIADKEQFTRKALDIWLNFGKRTTGIILKYLDDIELIEKAIREMVAYYKDEWTMQHMLYELLKECYNTLGQQFDELAIASSMTAYNPNFLNDVARAYMNLEKWEDAAKTIKEALQKVEAAPVIAALNVKLVDSYEKLGMYSEAFDSTVKMFFSSVDNYYSGNSHSLYKRARFFAEKLDNVSTFANKMEKYVQSFTGYDSLKVLLTMLSFEGRTEKLLEAALKSSGYSRHDYLKYTCKSLIYRAVNSEKGLPANLSEYVTSIEDNKISGIVDMIKLPEDSSDREYLLNNAVKVLKIMVQFHIDAASRSRYQRAAYYCAVIKDICAYSGKTADFDEYYIKIIQENKRRPALKDEMKKKIGYN